MLAHKARGYDAQFVARWLVNKGLLPKIAYNGRKILQLKAPALGIAVRDSQMMLHEPLRELPKCFGLKEQKGDFPHGFHKPENFDYVGCHPAMEYYGYGRKTTRQKKEFDEWYDKEVEEYRKQNKKWVLRDELRRYC